MLGQMLFRVPHLQCVLQFDLLLLHDECGRKIRDPPGKEIHDQTYQQIADCQWCRTEPQCCNPVCNAQINENLAYIDMRKNLKSMVIILRK